MSCLFVQGPPGSGKTYTGAHVIVRPARRGAEGRRRLDQPQGDPQPAARGRAGAQARAPLRAGSRRLGTATRSRFASTCRPHDRERDRQRRLPAGQVTLVAGTAWLFAREELDGWLDLLVIDEAGQVSLADALAMATAARNVVLLGDPCQLAQVSQGRIRPARAAPCWSTCWATGHGGARARCLPRADLGHAPDICGFVSEAVYEGRLVSEACAPAHRRPRARRGRAVRRRSPTGNARPSPEEAARSPGRSSGSSAARTRTPRADARRSRPMT